MKGILDQWRTCKRLIDKVDATYRELAEHDTEPSPLLCLLPAAYAALMESECGLDKNAVTLASHYLASQHPELQRHLMTGEQQAQLDALKDRLSAYFEDTDATS